MSDTATNSTGGHGSALYKFLHRLCIASAATGGLVIFVASFVVTFSVVRSLIGFGAVRGEFELVELACTSCASLFLPLCQLLRGHVMVDVFTNWLPIRTKQALDALWMLSFAAGWAFVCWRLFHGLMDVRGYGDNTMLLRVPLWWVYAPAVFGTGVSAIVAAMQGLSWIMPRWLAMEKA
jgi:TRAP-type C4-dicarboxylate transport system permease small subunit